MGWMDFIGATFKWLGGESIAQSLVRVALGVGLMRFLNKSTSNGQNTNSSSSVSGTRQQISPATDNKLPVAYGDAYFSGTIIDVQLQNENKELIAVINLCEQTGDIFSTSPFNPSGRAASVITIDDIYISNQKVVFMNDGTTVSHTIDDTGVIDSSMSGLVGIFLYQGNSNSPMLPRVSGTNNPITGTVPPAAYTIMPGWTASHTNQNSIFAIIKMNYDPSKGIHSIPAAKFHVRNTLTKPGDVLHDYMTNALYGGGIVESLINNNSIVELNSYSDEQVNYPPHPTQPRYRINGLIRTTEPVMSNMERIAASAGSYISFDVTIGKWGAISNKVTAKTLDFNDSNILGQIALSGTGLDSFYNSVEVQFPYSILRDQLNFTRIDLPSILRAENESDNMLQITHELVNNVVQASLLGNLELRQSREDLSIVFNTDFSKFNTQVGNVIGVTNSVYGWSNKLFRVIRIRKNESTSGQLTLEITALSYNNDVYTVEPISNFTPLIGAGHSIPSLSPIQTPLAPGVHSATLSSQPSFTITGIVPVGVVTEMEFWYTKDTNPIDSQRAYTLLGTMRAENSGPFTTGDTTSFKTLLLVSGFYYFKVRAANEYTSSIFSPPSAGTDYVYVQAPDVLKYETPVVDNITGAAAGGLSLGLLAGYVATKLNWFGPGGIFSGNASLSSIFGIGQDAADAISAAAAADRLLTNTGPAFDHVTSDGPGEVVLSSNGTTLNFKAGPGVTNDEGKFLKIKLSTEAGTNTVIIDADTNCCGSGGTTAGNTTITGSSTLCGNVFPMLFGTGRVTGNNSRAGIFTHDHLVFGGSKVAEMKEENVIPFAANVNANVNGIVQFFFNFPSLSSGWSQKPLYDETATDKFTANTQITCYYSTCTYAGGSLDAQAWTPWRYVNSNNGITGMDGAQVIDHPAVYANVWSNPTPTITSCPPTPYCVDTYHTSTGLNEKDLLDDHILVGTTSEFANYDPFKPNKLIVNKISDAYQETIIRNDRAKVRELSTGTLVDIPFAGGPNDLIAFGVSVYNLPNNTPYPNNTVHGHVGPVFIATAPNAISLSMVVNNGGTYVGINSANQKIYYSTNGKDFTRVTMDGDVTNVDDWAGDTFTNLIYDGTKFIVYTAFGQSATSTNGTTWVQHSSIYGLSPMSNQVVGNGSGFVATTPNGIQTSVNGIDWVSPVQYSAFNGSSPTSVAWDGSKYIAGGSGSDSAIVTSPDGLTWTPDYNLSHPELSQEVSPAENYSLVNSLSESTPSLGMLP